MVPAMTLGARLQEIRFTIHLLNNSLLLIAGVTFLPIIERRWIREYDPASTTVEAFGLSVAPATETS